MGSVNTSAVIGSVLVAACVAGMIADLWGPDRGEKAPVTSALVAAPRSASVDVIGDEMWKAGVAEDKQSVAVALGSEPPVPSNDQSVHSLLRQLLIQIQDGAGSTRESALAQVHKLLDDYRGLVVGEIVDLLDSAEERLQLQAIRAAGLLALVEVTDSVEFLATGDDVSLRAPALEALVILAPDRCRALVRACLTDEDNKTRALAVKSIPDLARAGAPGALDEFLPLLVEMLGDPYTIVHGALPAAITSIFRGDGGEMLVAKLRAEAPMVRLTVAKVLLSVDASRFGTEVTRVLSDAVPGLVVEVARALAEARVQSAVPALVSLARDVSQPREVRVAAIEALLTLGAVNQDLSVLLTDAEPVVRVLAARSMVLSSDTRGLQVLVDALSITETSPDEEHSLDDEDAIELRRIARNTLAVVSATQDIDQRFAEQVTSEVTIPSLPEVELEAGQSFTPEELEAIARPLSPEEIEDDDPDLTVRLRRLGYRLPESATTENFDHAALVDYWQRWVTRLLASGQTLPGFDLRAIELLPWGMH